jgi:hypothetical protein
MSQPEPKNLEQAALDLFLAVKHFLDRYVKTGDAKATLEDIQKFSAAFSKAQGDS